LGVTQNVDRLVDHLFRHKAGEMIAILTRHVGARHLSLVEDVVQEALTRALRDWPFKGVPADPSAWLFRVARNAALDAVRRQATRTRYEADVVDLLEWRLASEDARSFATKLRTISCG
jgi:predicted RNA polymerase sigma factor